MNRRSFISSILALGTAPAIVRADSLMRIVPMDTVVEYDTYALGYLITPEEFWAEYRLAEVLTKNFSHASPTVALRTGLGNQNQ